MRTSRASAMLMAALAASLLAGAAMVLMIDARAARASSGEALRLARAELRAQSLLQVAIVRLDDEMGLTPQGILFAEADGARVLRQDASGLVDLNTAPPELLARLMTGLGLPAELAITIADRAADWRDEDALRRPHGAEAADYARASLAAPLNRPFETEGELIAVMGMTPALMQCVAPYLTIYSGLNGVDFSRAPTSLVRLLGEQAPSELPTATMPGTVILLTAEAPLSPHAVLRRTIWLRLTRDPARPYMIHRAAQDLAPRQAATPHCDLGAA